MELVCDGETAYIATSLSPLSSSPDGRTDTWETNMSLLNNVAAQIRVVGIGETIIALETQRSMPVVKALLESYWIRGFYSQDRLTFTIDYDQGEVPPYRLLDGIDTLPSMEDRCLLWESILGVICALEPGGHGPVLMVDVVSLASAICGRTWEYTDVGLSIQRPPPPVYETRLRLACFYGFVWLPNPTGVTSDLVPRATLFMTHRPTDIPIVIDRRYTRVQVPQCMPICTLSEALLRSIAKGCIVLRFSVRLSRKTPGLAAILNMIRDIISDWVIYYMLPFGGYDDGRWVEFLQVPTADVHEVLEFSRMSDIRHPVTITQITNVRDVIDN